MTTAAELFALQETDLANDDVVARLTEVEAKLGETEELIEARQQVDQCRERLRPLEERQKGLDWEVEEVRGKASAIESKLYGGTLGNPKELEDFQADLTSLRGQLSRREDSLLEVMLEREDAETGLRQAEATLAEVEESWKTQQTSLQETQATLKEEIAGLEGKHTGQVDGMDAAALSLYQALRERREGTAVAVVERGLCQGCRISLPMSVVQKARAGAGLVKCVSCERILLVS